MPFQGQKVSLHVKRSRLEFQTSGLKRQAMVWGAALCDILAYRQAEYMLQVAFCKQTAGGMHTSAMIAVYRMPYTPCATELG